VPLLVVGLSRLGRTNGILTPYPTPGWLLDMSVLQLLPAQGVKVGERPHVNRRVRIRPTVRTVSHLGPPSWVYWGGGGGRYARLTRPLLVGGLTPLLPGLPPSPPAPALGGAGLCAFCH
jgi:hypothetical protein